MKMKKQWKIAAAVIILFSTILTTGCGKTAVTKKIDQSEVNHTEKFSEVFFARYHFPYQKINRMDVQNMPEEYLFYLKDGAVYRTIHDYTVVIVNRHSLSESESRKKENYTGELYRIFEEDDMDLLVVSASGNYAILSLPSAIPDYANSELIQSFVGFAASYKD